MTRVDLNGGNGHTSSDSETKELQQFRLLDEAGQIKYLTRLLSSAADAMSEGVSDNANQRYDRCKRYQKIIAEQHKKSYTLIHPHLRGFQSTFQGEFERCKQVRHDYSLAQKRNSTAETLPSQPHSLGHQQSSSELLASHKLRDPRTTTTATPNSKPNPSPGSIGYITEKTLMQPGELDYFADQIAPDIEETGCLDFYLIRLENGKMELFQPFNHPDEVREFATTHQPTTPQDQYIFRKEQTPEGPDYTLITLEQLAEQPSSTQQDDS
jgi:hypothetical protein